MSQKKQKYHFATQVIHAGQEPCPDTGAVMPPIYTTSTYKQSEPGVHTGYEYSRAQNPTRNAFEKCIAELEHGTNAFAFASGMAAIDAIINILAPGDHVIASDDLYGGTYRLFTRIKAKKAGLEFSFVDCSNKDAVLKHVKSNTKMLWIETPTNPLLNIVDLQEISNLLNTNFKNQKIIKVVDNTFATPYIQKPLDLGFDLVMHSSTKYINGHADIIGGVVVVDANKNPELKTEVGFLQFAIGAIQGPFDCYLALRGVKTLEVRMERHCSNALYIAEKLQNHKLIKKIYYPGLSSHKGHEIAKKQMHGRYGGIVTIELNCDYEKVKKFLKNLQIFTLAESLGGVESLINHPAKMTHASIPEAMREQKGIVASLLRLSVGIENQDDLLQDLLQALETI